MIDCGVYTIMTGHLGLPWMDPGTDYRGPMPATLSSKIQIDLLRKRLGFTGGHLGRYRHGRIFRHGAVGAERPA